ncbi:putative membrane protein [Catenuloplanes nepalensis]|uniref:Membrane protein n=1 Tax=Catenuloplanes nepalensis TaxID=587533 RepID=A0ABT9MK11_9ACTN|nr:hypothetical protein [Catenuloplanes nepalensis]MDP9791628.1 putative membrane protein [Catenuloplanes nepalensis]
MARNWGDESWENIVNQVVIDGRPGDLRTAALGWEAVLRNLNSVKTSLDTNVTDLGTVWKGDAYEAFKTHIETISEKIQHVVDEANGTGSGGVVTSLNQAADDLHAAQEVIPVPIAMQPEVMQARDAHLAIPIGSFENAIRVDIAGAMGTYRDIGNAVTFGLAEKVWTAVQDALTNGSEEALQHWRTLNGQVADTAAATPAGTPVGYQSFAPTEEVPLGSGGPSGGVGGGPGGGGGGGAPKLGAGAPSGIGSVSPTGGSPFDSSIGNTPYTPPINDSTGGFDPEVGTGYTPGGGADFDPSTPTGTGLAGAGGGLGTGGLGAGGLGSGGLSGLGGAGAGGLGAGGGLGSAGGLGAGGAGGIPGGGALGKPVSGAGLAGLGAAGMGGMGAGAGAKGAGKGGAAKGGKPMLSGGVAPGTGAGKGGAGRAGAGGMAGMGGGHGAGFGGEEERSTWLQEDDDVWGGGDAAPGVLR